MSGVNQHARFPVSAVGLSAFKGDVPRVAVMGDPQRAAQAHDLVVHRARNHQGGALLDAVHVANRGNHRQALGGDGETWNSRVKGLPKLAAGLRAMFITGSMVGSVMSQFRRRRAQATVCELPRPAGSTTVGPTVEGVRCRDQR